MKKELNEEELTAVNGGAAPISLEEAKKNCLANGGTWLNNNCVKKFMKSVKPS